MPQQSSSAAPAAGAAAVPPASDLDVRVGPLMPIAGLLREAGFEPRTVLARFGLQATVFDDADTRIAFDTAGRLIQECARITRREDFGLLIAGRFDFAIMGVIGKLMQQAPSVGAALQNLQRYFHLNDRGAVPYLNDLGNGQVALGYAVYRHATPAIGLIHDVALGIAWQMLRALCGARWKPTLVSFAHGCPANPAAYRRFFGVAVDFDAAHSEIRFDAQWLAAPIAGADAALHAAVQCAADALEAGDPPHIVDRTRRLAQALVMTGMLSGAHIAQLLPLHERTLRRQLQAAGCKLQHIINEVRFEVACQLLGETRLPLPDLAAALGYADATAFSRAFKGWAGCAPRHWRAIHHV
jgi:AraC-like DNA-binding protein